MRPIEERLKNITPDESAKVESEVNNEINNVKQIIEKEEINININPEEKEGEDNGFFN